MRQDNVSVFNKFLVIVLGVLVGVFLLFIAVGGEQVDYGGLGTELPVAPERYFAEPEPVTINCETEGLRIDYCLSQHQYKMWNGEHYELQPAVGINKYQNTSRVSLQPQGFEGQ